LCTEIFSGDIPNNKENNFELKKNCRFVSQNGSFCFCGRQKADKSEGRSPKCGLV